MTSLERPSAQALPSVAQIIRLLVRQQGPVKRPPPRNAFEWVLWENVAYLADDAKRATAFALLKKTVGLSPTAILGTSHARLLTVTKFGIVADLFARKLRLAAELADERFGGKVDQALSPELKLAAKQLRVFPGIGEPGAEKILVAIGRARTLPLESNGLRVMVRLGFGNSLKSYGATYRSVRAAVPIGRTTARSLFDA